MDPPRSPGSPNLRVALVCPYSLSRPGGVQGQVMGLSRVLTGRGHPVTVFAPLDDVADAPDGIDLVVSGRSVPVPANGSRAPVSLSPMAAAHGVRALRRGRFDVVHVHEPFAPGLPYGLLVASGIPPLVATFHRSGASVFYSLLGPVAKLAARRFAVRCAVSEAARQTAASAIGGNYQVLFNGVEVDRFRDADPWPKDGPTVLFLGRHEERKGLRVLLEAWRTLIDGGIAAQRATAVLWIAGDGPETEALKRQFPASPTIRWLGVVTEEEKVRRLAAADVLCAPSLGGESFGMVLLEAMAADTLVVASDIDGYRDVVGGDAVLVPPGDAHALGEALESTLAAGEDGRSGGDPGPPRLAAASARAERWSMNRLAERYEAVYRSVAVRSGR